jgi:hypothetical protein
MKTIKLLSFASAVFLVTSLFFGCTEDFEEVNTNQRTLSELDAAMLGNIFARFQYRGYFINYHQTPQTLFADYYTQYTMNLQNAFPSDRYIQVGGWINGCWTGFYGNVAGNLGVLLEETDPAEYPDRATMWAIAKVWSVAAFERISSYWGPIPYSQINNGEPSVPYDKQEDIYRSFFPTLDEALAILNANQGGNAFGDNDQIYGGDINKWITFGNTLRLRLAMRVSDVDPGLAQQQAEKAVADGVMTTKDDNALFKCTANSIHNMPRMLPWAEFRMSATMESILQGYQDPRMPLMYSPAVTDGEYRGARNGYSIESLGTIPELLPDNLSDYGPRYIPVSQQDVLPYEIMWSPEAFFLRAEGVLKGWNMGGGTAEEYYNSGIEASFEYWTDWGLDMGTLAAYQQSANVPVATWDAPNPISTVPVKFDASDDAIALEQIHIQKWLGLWPDGWEAYADQRRSELPKRYDIMVSENPNVDVNQIVRRIEFVNSEYEQNAAAVEAAKGLLGGPDNAATRLWWDPN